MFEMIDDILVIRFLLFTYICLLLYTYYLHVIVTFQKDLCFIQWNLSVTTTSIVIFIICNSSSDVF